LWQKSFLLKSPDLRHFQYDLADMTSGFHQPKRLISVFKGKCCINYSDGGLSASQSDLDFWEAYRPHIYQYVKMDELWFDPVTAQQLSVCPFLTKTEQNLYTCDIYQIGRAHV